VLATFITFRMRRHVGGSCRVRNDELFDYRTCGAHDVPVSVRASPWIILRPAPAKTPRAEIRWRRRSASSSHPITKRFSPMKPSIAFCQELGGFDLDEARRVPEAGVRKQRSNSYEDTSNFLGHRGPAGLEASSVATKDSSRVFRALISICR